MDVLAKFKFTDVGEQYGVLAIRHSGTWKASDLGVPQDGYFLNIEELNDNIALEKAVSGTRTVLNNTAFVNTSGVWYWVRFQCIGTTIRYKRWTDGGAEPSTWTASVTDSAHVSGIVGMSHYNDASATARTITWDDLTITALSASSLVNTPAIKSKLVALVR